MKKAPSFSETLSVARTLRALPPVRAPRTLAAAVIRRVGLGDTFWKVDSPIGSLFIARGPAGISLLRRTDSAARFEREFFRRYGRRVSRDTRPVPASLRRAVRRIAAGDGATGSEVTLDLRALTDFERAVLRKALEIPAGEVWPYGWIAREIGRPEAVRATGTALAKNPVPLLIPCHRVVRSDGQIGRYVFGGRAKRALLLGEGVPPRELEALAASGIRFLGNARRRYFCLPTCGGFDHLIRANRVGFSSAREALDAGYHPCADCRPVALAS